MAKFWSLPLLTARLRGLIGRTALEENTIQNSASTIPSLKNKTIQLVILNDAFHLLWYINISFTLLKVYLGLEQNKKQELSHSFLFLVLDVMKSPIPVMKIYNIHAQERVIISVDVFNLKI